MQSAQQLHSLGAQGSHQPVNSLRQIAPCHLQGIHCMVLAEAHVLQQTAGSAEARESGWHACTGGSCVRARERARTHKQLLNACQILSWHCCRARLWPLPRSLGPASHAEPLNTAAGDAADVAWCGHRCVAPDGGPKVLCGKGLTSWKTPQQQVCWTAWPALLQQPGIRGARCQHALRLCVP